MSLSEIALSHVGQMEITGNKGFVDPEFEKRMREVGFQSGHSWCVYFAELCAKEAFPDRYTEFDKLFTPNAMATLERFRKAGYKIHTEPKADTVVIWQKYHKGEPQFVQDGNTTWWLGHAGICVKAVNSWIFNSVEGNTNDGGSREGDRVAHKFGRKCLAKVTTGLKVVGFIEI
jgi:hypothetical protein